MWLDGRHIDRTITHEMRGHGRRSFFSCEFRRSRSNGGRDHAARMRMVGFLGGVMDYWRRAIVGPGKR